MQLQMSVVLALAVWLLSALVALTGCELDSAEEDEAFFLG